MRAWCHFFLLFILFLCTCICDSVRACRGGYFEMSNILAGISEYSTVSVISLLLLFFTICTDPLSSLESTPVLIYVPKQVHCIMCRISNCFSFFFCKDDSDRLMKRASYSCCIFVCVVLAAAYLKYRRYRLSCLPFVWHFFFIVTHTCEFQSGHLHAYGKRLKEK